MKKLFCACIILVAATLAGSAQVAETAAAAKPASRNTGGSAGAYVGPGTVYTWTAEDRVNTDQLLKQIEDATRAAMENADGNARKAYQEAMQALQQSAKRSRGLSKEVDIMSNNLILHNAPEAPVLVLASPMEKKDRDQLQEDLRVMDQLLRDEFKRQDADSGRRALGIKLLMSGRNQSGPMYVEGYGAIFDFDVTFPLMGNTEKTAAKPEDEPPPGSAWDRAKREVQSSKRTESKSRVIVQHSGGGGGYGGAVNRGYGGTLGTMDIRSGTPYDPDRLEALVDAIINALGEAKNIRNLKPSDAVTVTIGGTDDSGNPIRLTLKALKADIDKFAAGKMTQEEFRKTISRNIG